MYRGLDAYGKQVRNQLGSWSKHLRYWLTLMLSSNSLQLLLTPVVESWQRTLFSSSVTIQA